MVSNSLSWPTSPLSNCCPLSRWSCLVASRGSGKPWAVSCHMPSHLLFALAGFVLSHFLCGWLLALSGSSLKATSPRMSFFWPDLKEVAPLFLSHNILFFVFKTAILIGSSLSLCLLVRPLTVWGPQHTVRSVRQGPFLPCSPLCTPCPAWHKAQSNY